MPPRHFSRYPARRPQRRKLVWTTTQTSFANVGNGSSHSQDLLTELEVAGASKLGITVMRMHLELVFTYASATVTGWDWGIKIATQDEIANLISVATSQNDDWMMIRHEFPEYTGATINAQRLVHVDLKAKRRCEEMNETLGFFVTNNVGTAQTMGIFARTLIALP